MRWKRATFAMAAMAATGFGAGQMAGAAEISVDLAHSGAAPAVAWEPGEVEGDPDAGSGRYYGPTDEYLLGARGSGGSRRLNALVFTFELPELAAGEYFSSAALSVTLNVIRGDVPTSVDIWGVGHQSTSDVSQSFWYAGHPDDAWLDDFAGSGVGIPDQMHLAEEFITIDSELGSHTTEGEAAENLAQFLNALYASGAQGGDHAIVRLNAAPWWNPNEGGAERYEFEGTPTLTGTLVPEPAAFGLAALSGVLMLRRRRLA